MTFDPAVVDDAVRGLKNTTRPTGLKPTRILLCSGDDDSHFALLGVGVEFPYDIRNAVAFNGPLASDNYAETKRQIEEWIAS